MGSIPTEVKRFFSLGAVHFYEKEGGGLVGFFLGGSPKKNGLKGGHIKKNKGKGGVT